MMRIVVFEDEKGVFTNVYRINDNGVVEEILSNILTIVGRNGIIPYGKQKCEGDGFTPQGEYSIVYTFGYGEPFNGSEVIKGIPYLKINYENDYVWVDDENSKKYNTLQRYNQKNDWNSAEDLFHELYEYTAVIDYNKECIHGNGSAIFLHKSREGNTPTAGCIAWQRDDLLNIFRVLDKNTSICILGKDR
ncbi:MAG TPA: hypothetical protein DEP72_02375 [Clostridiales bacterium]|nr:hypothetical protein [Clostridiales bacterium]